MIGLKDAFDLSSSVWEKIGGAKYPVFDIEPGNRIPALQACIERIKFVQHELRTYEANPSLSSGQVDEFAAALHEIVWYARMFSRDQLMNEVAGELGDIGLLVQRAIKDKKVGDAVDKLRNKVFHAEAFLKVIERITKVESIKLASEQAASQSPSTKTNLKL